MIFIVTLLVLFICWQTSTVIEQNRALGRNDVKISAQLTKLQKTLDNMPR